MSRQTSFTWRIAHLPRPLRWPTVLEAVHRLVADPTLGTLTFETRATPAELQFLIGADQGKIRAVGELLGDLVPGLCLTTLERARTPLDLAAGVSVSHPSLSLETGRVEALTRAILASMSGLAEDEELALQVIVGSRLAPVTTTTEIPDARQPWWSLLTIGTRHLSGEALARTSARRRQHGALVSLRLAATSSTPPRAKALIQRLFGGLRVAEAAGVRLRLTPDSPLHFNSVRIPWRYPLRLSASEIACLLGWPIGDGDLPGLPPVSPRLIAPPAWLDASAHLLRGRVFARTNGPGPTAPVGVGPSDALLHTVLLGPTGAGKSTAMAHLIQADIEAGRGVVVIDPKNDLVTDLLERVPDQRLHDVVVIDPTDASPVGLNPLSGVKNPELAVDALLATFKALFADSWGVRTEEILTACLLTLAKAGGDTATLIAIPSLLTNSAFRRTVTAAVRDPLGVSAFWAKYEAKSPEQQAVEIAPVLNKLQQFVIRPQIRAVLGQVTPRFQLRDVFTKRSIVLVSLNKGIIGGESARLLGSLPIGQLWPLILSRAAQPKERRHLVSVYVDEVHDFIHGIPGDLADALAQSRSLGVAWHMAHQYRAQLTTQMKGAIDANARNKICFGLSAPDARDMAATVDSLDPLDFIRLPRFATYSNTWIGGRATGWISATALPPTPSRHTAIDIKAASSHAYGVPAHSTEALLESFTGATAAHAAPYPRQKTQRFGRKPTKSDHLSDDEPIDRSTQ